MSYWGACERVVLGLILALSFSATASAQEQQQRVENAQLRTAVNPANNAPASSAAITASPTADKWQFVSLSYLSFPGIHGTVGAKGYTSYTSVSPSVSPSDLLSHFNFGIMGSFEAQYDQRGISFDFVYAKLVDNKTFTNFPGYSANPTVKKSC
jgi:hypothetical protein